MAYIATGNRPVQDYIHNLSINDEFNNLSLTNQIQYINIIQQQCADMSKDNGLTFYKATDTMKN